MKNERLRLRKRSVFLTTTFILTCLLWVLTDPSLSILRDLPFGSGLISTLVISMSAIIGLVLLYLSRKNLMDYAVADFKILGETAITTATGAGLYAIAVSIMTLSFSIIIAVAML